MKDMKTYIKTVVLLMTVVLGLASCSNDVLKGSNEPVKADTDGLRVRFSLESDAKARTRADYSGTLIAGFDREKTIDANQSYAVVYKGDGTTFYKAFKLSYNNEDAQNPYYYFNVENGGYYYMYVVANCSLDLTAAAQTTTLSAGGPSALFGLVETTDPGTNKQASTNFLMISGKTLVDVDGNEDTDLGSVALTRAAVRFDIDVTAITGFQITSVDVTKRATSTKLARTGSDTSMDGLDIAAGTEIYTVGTGSGQVPDNHETYVEGTDGYYVSPGQWIGVIYGYENLNAAAADATTVTVHGTLLGRTVEHTVNFGELTTPVQPKRNTIYTIKLTADGSGVGVGDIHSDIVVKDWAEGATIIYTGLKDDTTPSFRVTSTQDGDDYPNDGDSATKTNPGTIVTDGEANTVIQLEVTGSKVGSRLTCTGRYDYSEGTTVQVSNSEVTCTAGAVTSNDAGNIVQTWTITMLSALDEDDYLTFSLMNEYDQVNAKRTFKVTGWKDAHIGDFYYSDGTWSTEKDNSKTVIGLVFCTTPTSDDQARGYKHGYVIALKDYADANDTKWAEATADVNGIMDDYSITQANQFGGAAINSTLSEPASIDLNGLTNTLKIAAKASGKTYGSDATLKLSDITDTKYHAAYKAVNFASSSNGVAAPAKSSGWYLPSIGQQYLWLYYFGNVKTVPQNFRDQYKDCYWNNPAAPNAGSAMNTYFTSKVGAGNYTSWDENKAGKYYWSSTVRSASGYPFYLDFHTSGNLVLNGGVDATYTCRVRPVLAF